MEHRIWKGPSYETAHEKYFIIGHSHYCKEAEAGSPDMTYNLLKHVVDGRWSIPFLSSIAKAFGSKSAASFYKEVIFFNYVPECIGTADNKFDSAPDPLLQLAKERFLRELREHKPDRVFVFSNSPGKGWRTFPNTLEEQQLGFDKLNTLGDNFPEHFKWGTYDAGGKLSLACGIRHTLYAKSEQLREAVSAFKQVPLP